MAYKDITKVSTTTTADSIFVNDGSDIKQITKENLASAMGLANDIHLKGADTSANIKAKTGTNGDKWYSNDENAYYIYMNGWVNVGSGEDYSELTSRMDAVQKTIDVDIPQLDKRKGDSLEVDGGVLVLKSGTEELSSIQLPQDVTVSTNRKIYGVECSVDSNGDIQANATWTRTDSAVGMTANASFDGNAVINDFDTADCWPTRKRCNMHYDTNGKAIVSAYNGEPGYVENDPTVPVMVETQKFYYFKGVVGNKYQVKVSTKMFPGSRVSDNHLDINNNAMDYCYSGAFEGTILNGKLTCCSGIQPGNNVSNLSGIPAARNVGNYFNLETVKDIEMIKLLMLVEFATTNTQAAIGNGVCSMPSSGQSTVASTGNTFITTNAVASTYNVGQTISIGSSTQSGSIVDMRVVTDISTYDTGNKTITFDGASATIPVGSYISSRPWITGGANSVKATSGTMSNDGRHSNIYRGTENPFDNCCEVIGDVIFHNGTSTYYYCEDPTKWRTDETKDSNYVELSYKASKSAGYVKRFGYDERYPFISLTSGTGGDSGTYYCDYVFKDVETTAPDTLRECLVGGSLDKGAYGGLSSWSLFSALSYVHWAFAGRLSASGRGGLGDA